MSAGRRGWMAARGVAIVVFLLTVASYYRSPGGFTAFLTFPVDTHDAYELPAVRTVPRVEVQDGGYDGQFYARIALVPLLRDPAIDLTLDLPPYRARRILFSWTAYLIGLGRPAWVLEVFALQNVVAWLIFSWLLLRWFPPGDARGFLLWAACLFTHGMLSSVRYALLDAPSALLLAGAVVAVERAQPWTASIALAAAGLARETNLLGLTLLWPFLRRTRRSWLLVAGATAVALIPTLLWMDYLRSIYRSGSFTGGGNITMPFSGLGWKVGAMARDLHSSGLTTAGVFNICGVVSFLVQTACLSWLALRSTDRRSPWLALALSFAALGLVAHQVVWAGAPGAITRVALPLALGFNVLFRRHPWPLLLAGNLGVVPGVLSFVFRM